MKAPAAAAAVDLHGDRGQSCSTHDRGDRIGHGRGDLVHRARRGRARHDRTPAVSRRRRLTRGGGVVLLLSALLIAGAGADPTPAEATPGWASTTFATTSVAAGTIAPVPQVACGAGSGLLAGDIPISWTASPSGGTALAPDGYTLRWAGTAGSGSITVTGTSGSVTGATLTLLGTSTVTVTANYAGWTSPPSLQTRTITTVAGLAGAILLWSCA